MKQPYGDRSRLRDYREAFGTEAGKRVLLDLLNSCYFFHSTFEGDALTMAHREGRRDVALIILKNMNLKPSDIPQLAMTHREQVFEETVT